MTTPVAAESTATAASTLPETVQNLPSTWDSIKNGTISSANWLGRQVQWIASSIKDGVLKIVEWVKPMFQAIAKFSVERFEKLQELIANNKETSLLLTAAISITAITTIAATYLFCGGAKQ